MKYYSKIQCPLCNSEKYKVLFKSTLKKDDFGPSQIKTQLKNSLDNFLKHGQIVKCNECSLVYVNPLEDTHHLMKGYTDVVDKEYLETEKFRKILFTKHLEEILKFKKKGTLLDVGCFCGFFLELAKKKKFKCYGLEPSDWATSEAKKRKIEVIGKSLKDIHKQTFDIITLFDVIEHLPNPKRELQIINNALNNDGLLVVGTPNIESLTVKLLKGKHPFFIRMHIVLFGKKTLTKALTDCGFTIQQVSYYGRTYPLSYYLERLKFIIPLSSILINMVKNIPALFAIPITINMRDEILVIARKES